MIEPGYASLSFSPFALHQHGDRFRCNLGSYRPGSTNGAVCLIPTQALHIVERPTEKLETAPNVLAEWMRRFLDAGAQVVLVHGRWFDSFEEMRRAIERGGDPIARMTERISIVVDEIRERLVGPEARIIIMGSSRHGFAALHAAAHLSRIDACAAHQPVIHWPELEEFRGLNDSDVIRRHGLFTLSDRFPPRPLLIQTGYADRRIGQYWIDRLVGALRSSYRSRGHSPRFTHELMDIPGHDGTKVPMKNMDSVTGWMRRQGLFEPARA